jgi:N-acetylmuramoyl-L-alanine amidase
VFAAGSTGPNGIRPAARAHEPAAKRRPGRLTFSLDAPEGRKANKRMSFLAMLLSALLGLAPGLSPLAPDADPAEAGSLTIDLEAEKGLADPVNPPVHGPPGRPLVVIDAGHGGRDPGAISPFGGRREKDITLELARAIRDELLASGRVRVALTRNDDRYIVHRERYEIARRLGAGLFLSVHADAAPANDDAHGASVYTLSEVASDRQAALLAEQENKSDVIAGVSLGGQDADVNRILIDLAQRESMDASAEFAQLLQREASAFFPFRPNYHRFASLLVLKAPDIPSILFESGYLTNATDARYIQSPEGQKQIAIGIRRAVEVHFARRMVRTAQR